MQIAATQTLPARSAIEALPVGTADVQRARADAARALQQIDFGKRTIVLYVPGTTHHDTPQSFTDAIRGAFAAGTFSLSTMDYVSSWNLPYSQPTGELTLRLVLAAIAAHPGTHQVVLAGESQGAWIIGDIMADQRYTDLIAGAALFGHPSVARHHYDRGQDPRAIEINNAGDPIADEARGSRHDHVRAISALYTNTWKQQIPLLLKVVLMNPALGTSVIMRSMRAKGVLPKLAVDPHDYDQHHIRAAQFLRSRLASVSSAQLPGGGSGVSTTA